MSDLSASNIINPLELVLADWPAPANVHALTTTRQIRRVRQKNIVGDNQANYKDFNLALHTGGALAQVNVNRQDLIKFAALPAMPVWLNQIHGNKVVRADEVSQTRPVDADASITRKINTVCAVLTADCLPVFFCNRVGTEVAIAHAGWRGLHAGVLEQTVLAMQSAASDLLIYFGPAIGAAAFEVGAEVRQVFCEKNSQNSSAFKTVDAAHYLCDIYQLARIALETVGVTQFYGGGLCTCTDVKRFYSYRRNAEMGRLASLIWIEE